MVVIEIVTDLLVVRALPGKFSQVLQQLAADEPNIAR